jgi:hypothetical protein
LEAFQILGWIVGAPARRSGIHFAPDRPVPRQGLSGTGSNVNAKALTPMGWATPSLAISVCYFGGYDFLNMQGRQKLNRNNSSKRKP